MSQHAAIDSCCSGVPELQCVVQVTMMWSNGHIEVAPITVLHLVDTQPL